ncbi:MAG: hypothetical protein HYX71_04960 [Opitutae bacterium]|nr:hypothetical protein [Opitutae bacterium]
MNTPDTSSAAQESAHLEKLRSQLSTDIEAMQQKEASLKEYEQRLRLLVEHAHQTPPTQPTSRFYVANGPDSQEALDAEWDKYNRAHALLEAARRGLTDDRLAFKEREEKLDLREADVARREAWVAGREQELATREAATAARPEAKATFISAPFLAAKNFFTRQG